MTVPVILVVIDGLTPAMLEDAIASGATPEMFVIDLQEAQHAVDELLGGGDEEAVRDAIFSQFCIGK